MNILVTNDDGINAGNLMALALGAMECGNVKVVAPKCEQSGVGQGFSFYRSLHFGPAENFRCEAFWVDGTPSDCVKFGLKHIYKDLKFDLVLSGVNNGDNSGVASFYSGTVAAAREAALWGLPAIAVSLQKQSETALDFAVKWVQTVLKNKNFIGMPKQTLWNFNVPECSEQNPCKGVKISTTSTMMFNDYYVEAGEKGDSAYLLNEDSDVAGKGKACLASTGYNLMGNKVLEGLKEGSDDWWLAQGYASLSPQSVDLTDFAEYDRLSLQNIC